MNNLVSALSSDEARSLTDEVKHDAERLWGKLTELYNGQAHISLGYSSWGSYFETEFGQSKSSGYRMLEAAKVAATLNSPIGERPNEGQARELVPLLTEPEALNEAWKEAMETTNGHPTATAVKAAVQRRVISETERREMVTLRQQGKRIAEIAEMTGWSAAAISKVTSTRKPGRLPRRQQAGSEQTRALAKIHQACREWETVGDEDYIPAPELARRIRILNADLVFLTKKRNTYKEVAPNGSRSNA